MHALSRYLRAEFPAPTYLAPRTAGIDISTSGIKLAVLEEHQHGLELAVFEEYVLPTGSVVGGEIRERETVVNGIAALVKKHHVRAAHVALPESRGYLFDASVPAVDAGSLRIAIEQRLEEYVPLPKADVVFDVARIATTPEAVRVVGVGYASRVVDETLAVLVDASIEVKSIESETFSLPRALLAPSTQETVLIIDIGKTTTKLLITTNGLPHFVTTLDIGGHALTLAVAKHFGVSEEEAKRVKAEKGIVAGAGSEEYLAAMLSTVSVIRDEIIKRLEYWQGSGDANIPHEAVSRALLVGGNATVLGLPEYLEASLKIPVVLGDVFANFASRDHWLPPLEYTESLTYGTAIGLALRDYV